MKLISIVIALIFVGNLSYSQIINEIDGNPIYINNNEGTNAASESIFNVPLYTVEYKNFSKTLSLNYDPSGIRYDEPQTSVGLKWNLNFVEQINRKINGIPDEDHDYGWINSNGSFYINSTTIPFADMVGEFDETTSPTSAQLKPFLVDNTYDIAPDEFSFRLNGLIGDFVLNAGHPQSVHKLNNNNLEIQEYLGTGSSPYQFFVIDQNGIKYYFKFGDINSYTRLYTAVDRYSESSIASFNNPNYYLNFIVYKILFPDGNSIDINYSTEIYKSYSKSQSYATNGYDTYFNNIDLETQLHRNVISSITTPKETITFNYITPPTDADMQTKEAYLSSIEVKNKLNQVIKKYTLNYGYYTSSIYNTGVRYLSAIYLTDNNSNNNLVNSFNYSTTSLYRPFHKSDLYGYLNNNQDVNSIIPFNFSTYYADRMYDFSSMTVGMLNKVNFNDGGFATISYEPKIDYKETSTDLDNIYAGGLNVKEINYYESVGNLKYTKTYNYYDLEGVVEDYNNLENYQYEIDQYLYGGVINRYFSSRKGSPLQSIYSSNWDYNHSFGSYYRKISVETSIAGNYIGKIINYFEPALNKHMKSPNLVKAEKYNSSNILTNESNYTYNSFCNSSEYVLGLRVEKFYSKSLYATFRHYLNISEKKHYFNITSQLENKEEIQHFENGDISQSASFTYNSKNAIKTSTATNSDNDVITTEYIYVSELNNIPLGSDIDNMLTNNIDKPIQINKWKNKDEDDYLLSSIIMIYNQYGWITDVYEGETSSYLTTYPYTVDFESGGAGNLLFDHTFFKHRASLEYDQYGNLIKIMPEYNVTTSFLYGYLSSLKIAEVSNADFSTTEIGSTASYLGFESNNAANNNPDNDYWPLSGKTISYSTNAHTGTFYSKVNVGQEFGPSRNFQPNIDNKDRKYIFSAWVRTNGACDGRLVIMAKHADDSNLSGSSNNWYFSSPQFGNTNNEWQYFEVAIDLGKVRSLTDALADELLIFSCQTWSPSGNTFDVDDIRVNPSDSYMGTFSYKPLVGKTSKTDANNKTSYIEYDALNRYNMSRDMDKNILELINYNKKIQ